MNRCFTLHKPPLVSPPLWQVGRKAAPSYLFTSRTTLEFVLWHVEEFPHRSCERCTSGMNPTPLRHSLQASEAWSRVASNRRVSLTYSTFSTAKGVVQHSHRVSFFILRMPSKIQVINQLTHFIHSFHSFIDSFIYSFHAFRSCKFLTCATHLPSQIGVAAVPLDSSKIQRRRRRFKSPRWL